MPPDRDFYARLGIPYDATPEEIRSAFREAALRLHPDLNVKPGETEFFLEVKEAYETLSNPDKRTVYDARFPKDAQSTPALDVDVIFSAPNLVRSPEPQLIYALLEMTAPPGARASPGPPLNICLLLDCSTSMQGEVLDTVKLTAVEIVRQLRPVDLFSLVSFSDRAEVVIRGGEHVDRNKIETRIRMLRASGGTEIFQGLEAAYAEVLQNKRKGYLNHIILLTDGHTYGDEKICLALADRASLQGVSISALGIGPKYNDVFLDTLTARTGGSCLHVSTPKEIQHLLKAILSGLETSYASMVMLQFETGPGIKLEYAFRLKPDNTPVETASPLQMGSVLRNKPLSLLLEFSIEPQPVRANKVVLLQGFLAFDPFGQDLKPVSQRLRLERPLANERASDPPPPLVMQALARLTLYRLQEKAHKDLADGRIEDATRRLQRLATHLFAQGESDLAQVAIQEVVQIQNTHAFSEEGEKRIKYGTRALILPGSQSAAGTPSKRLE